MILGKEGNCMRHYLRRVLAAIGIAALLLTGASALTVEQAVELLEEWYIDDLPAEAYEAETVEEVFAALGDSYTYYMTAEDYAAFNSLVENTESLVGVGIAIQFSERGIEIVQVINGGPAEAAGLQSGDAIVAVDGVSCVPGTESISQLITGREGTSVTLTILHADGTLEDVSLVRSLVVVNNTNTSLLDGRIGVMECSSFGSETAELVRTGIETHEGEVEVWWMDLRGNAGGLADEAVEAIGIFAGGGIHLYYRDGAGDYYVDYTTEPCLTEHPVIVLTDSRSASASELFAAGIRDGAAGISIGGRTFGKGIAQILLDGENTEGYFTDDAIKVTSYRIFSANYNTTDRIGVLPTLLVDREQADEVARLLHATAPEDSAGWVRLDLGGWFWYLNLDDGEDKAWTQTLDCLWEALPPDAAVSLGLGGEGWTAISADAAMKLWGTSAQSRWFTDVTESDYAVELNVLATYGVLKGSGDGTFHPKGTLTRAELCAMICQTLNVEGSAGSVFEDVPAESWYAPYVMAMRQLGLMRGYGDGNFGPNELVSNEELIAVMGRLAVFLNAGLSEQVENFTEESFRDERLSAYQEWSKADACLMLYLQELREDGRAAVLYDALETVDPSAAVLREQAGAMLYNLLNVTGILLY